jgi:hypothetical protein
MDEHREVLYAPDVARALGISPRASRARLASLEGQPASGVRRIGNKLCISRRAFDRLHPGVQVPCAATRDGDHRRLFNQVQAQARAIHELRELDHDTAQGVQSLRQEVYQLREAVSALQHKSTSTDSTVKSSA